MSLALLLVLAVGAAYRATRLVTTDSLFEHWRSRLLVRFPPDREWARREWSAKDKLFLDLGRPHRRYPRKLGQLLDCPWCIGFWISGVTWGAVWYYHPLPLPGLWWPAIAVGVGALAAILER